MGDGRWEMFNISDMQNNGRYLLGMVCLLLIVSCGQNNTNTSEIDSEQEQQSNSENSALLKPDSGLFLSSSQFTPITFLQIITPKNQSDSQLNTFTIYTNFPADWVKASHIDTLMTLINSQQKCRCVKDPMGSYIPWKDRATMGGYAQLFLLSYIHKTPLELGLYYCPNTNKKSKTEILRWWKRYWKDK